MSGSQEWPSRKIRQACLLSSGESCKACQKYLDTVLSATEAKSKVWKLGWAQPRSAKKASHKRSRFTGRPADAELGPCLEACIDAGMEGNATKGADMAGLADGGGGG
mmetsp:Transcript_92232/g.164123  ORF Transcript_92232/g.164123 Transcript_92232/m.164123 type:complete len:107 (+) Transcript_92232:501-821(+)